MDISIYLFIYIDTHTHVWISMQTIPLRHLSELVLKTCSTQELANKIICHLQKAFVCLVGDWFYGFETHGIHHHQKPTHHLGNVLKHIYSITIVEICLQTCHSSLFYYCIHFCPTTFTSKSKHQTHGWRIGGFHPYVSAGGTQCE